jgi:cell division protease FtsH
MAIDGKKEPVENLKDKLRSLFSPQSPQKKKDALPPKAHFSIWYFLMAFLLFSSLQQYFLSRKVETIPYSQFKQYIAEGTLSKVTIGPENITGTLTEKDKKPAQTIKGQGKTQGQDQEFITVRVNDPDLVKDLDERKVDYSGHYEGKFLSTVLSWVIPIESSYARRPHTGLCGG